MREHNIDSKYFESTHRATLEEIQYARALVKGNIMIINHFIYTNELTAETLEDTLNDRSLQLIYALMVQAVSQKDSKTFSHLYKKVSAEASDFCGWLACYNEYLSESMGINLIPEDRDEYHYDDFLYGNGITQDESP